MELRNNSLSTGLNPGVAEVVSGTRAAHPYARPAQEDRSSGETTALDPDWATLSTAGSQAAQSTDGGGVRTDKIAAVRAALTAGTYVIPAAQVAQRAIGAMLGQGV